MDIELIKTFFIKHLLLPLVILLLLLVLVFLKKKLAFVKAKTMFIYILVCGLCLSIPGLFGFAGNMFSPYWYLIASLVYLVFGVTHVNQLHRRFRNDATAPWITIAFEVVITVVCMLLGGYLFAYLFDWLSPYKGYARISSTSLLVFLIPLLFYYAYIQFLNIPFSIYKTWQYVGNQVPIDFEGTDYNKLMVVNMELTKNISDGTRFRIKAKTLPEGVTFGDWFYRVIDDYNYKNPKSSIQLFDEDNEAFSWVFYTKKSFFHFRNYVDFDKDMLLNAIKENELVICKRVVQHKIIEKL